MDIQVAIQVSINKRVLNRSIAGMHDLTLEKYAKYSPQGALTWIEKNIARSNVHIDTAPDGDKNKDPFKLLRTYGGEVQIFAKNSKIQRALGANLNTPAFNFNVPR